LVGDAETEIGMGIDGGAWRMEDAITNYNNSPRGNFSAIIDFSPS